MFYGRGAGGPPTSVSVVGDITTVARNIITGGRGPGVAWYRATEVRSIDAMETQYYILLNVADRPGVLASVAGAFGEHGVSIASVWQEGFGDQAKLVMITHRGREADLQATLHDLRSLDAVTKVASVMRVEGGEAYAPPPPRPPRARGRSASDTARPPLARRRHQGRERHARGGRRGLASPASPQMRAWQGVIEEFRDRLPV